ncbi:MAG TPA: alpha/beta hydrolase [Acidimicrobiales bacterium]|nr:alpha/beta hydrolase [Acidimicrobiales bacterium]
MDLRRRRAWRWRPRCRAVDLPADDDAAGLCEYADAVVEAIGDRADAVLVAQSMGSFTAAMVCPRLPGRVSLLVLVNAMIPLPGETPGAWWANTGQPQARRENDVRAGRSPDADFDPLVYFFHDVPAEVTAWAIAGGRRQSDSVFASPCAIDAWPAVPTRILVGRDDRFFPADFQRRVAEERLGITPDEIPGGHLLAFSQPQELAGRIQALAAEQRAERTP